MTVMIGNGLRLLGFGIVLVLLSDSVCKQLLLLFSVGILTSMRWTAQWNLHCTVQFFSPRVLNLWSHQDNGFKAFSPWLNVIAGRGGRVLWPCQRSIFKNTSWVHSHTMLLPSDFSSWVISSMSNTEGKERVFLWGSTEGFYWAPTSKGFRD